MYSQEVNWHQVRRMISFVGILLGIVALLSYLFTVLVVPLLISCFLSYLLEPLVELMERKGIPRFFGILGIMILALAIVVIAAVAIVPAVYAQLADLLALVPGLGRSLYEHGLPMIKEIVLRSHVVSEESWNAALRDFNVLSQFTSPVRQAIGGLWRGTPMFVQGVVDAILIPIITFFILLDWPQIRALCLRLTPLDLRFPSSVFVERIDETLWTLIKGQLMVAGILAVLYSIGLSSIGLSSGLVIGLVAGMCRVIPYLDVIAGGGLSAIVLMSQFSSMGQVVGVVVVFTAVQIIDATYITPKVIGNRVGLHPLLVILAVIAFGHLLGFYGVLLAIPLTAILKVTMELTLPFYEASSAFDPSHGHPDPVTDRSDRAAFVASSFDDQNKV